MAFFELYYHLESTKRNFSYFQLQSGQGIGYTCHWRLSAIGAGWGEVVSFSAIGPGRGSLMLMKVTRNRWPTEKTIYQIKF